MYSEVFICNRIAVNTAEQYLYEFSMNGDANGGAHIAPIFTYQLICLLCIQKRYLPVYVLRVFCHLHIINHNILYSNVQLYHIQYSSVDGVFVLFSIRFFFVSFIFVFVATMSSCDRFFLSVVFNVMVFVLFKDWTSKCHTFFEFNHRNPNQHASFTIKLYNKYSKIFKNRTSVEQAKFKIVIFCFLVFKRCSQMVLSHSNLTDYSILYAYWIANAHNESNTCATCSYTA